MRRDTIHRDLRFTATLAIIIAFLVFIASCTKPHDECQTYVARAPQQRAELVVCDGTVPDTAIWIRVK